MYQIWIGGITIACCTFPHTTKRILVGLVGANASLHLWCVDSRLIGRVGSHVLPGESSWIITFREGVLQVNAASTEKQRRSGVHSGKMKAKV